MVPYELFLFFIAFAYGYEFIYKVLLPHGVESILSFFIAFGNLLLQPYGDVKDSGLGREGVKYAMEDMTELRVMMLHNVGQLTN